MHLFTCHDLKSELSNYKEVESQIFMSCYLNVISFQILSFMSINICIFIHNVKVNIYYQVNRRSGNFHFAWDFPLHFVK